MNHTNNISFNFKYIGNFDTSNFKKKIIEMSFQDWNEYSFRQRAFDVHKETQTIPLLFNENFSNDPKKYKHYNLFETQINELNDFFLNYYQKGKMVRCILVNLPANSSIPEHVDMGQSLVVSHRHHIPVLTNEHVYFKISNEVKNLKVDEVWEINNVQPHSVKNNSDMDRIHIIADWNTN